MPGWLARRKARTFPTGVGSGAGRRQGGVMWGAPSGLVRTVQDRHGARSGRAPADSGEMQVHGVLVGRRPREARPTPRAGRTAPSREARLWRQSLPAPPALPFGLARRHGRP
ncbi:hypothetical protein GCM10010964_31490 [Caldovatus sediminis]|uniref:Uncharacterized protein n=1 Tax=Caldovatus sediminis TaxID=2041189 RepID=A0A8J2ZCS1_9PROT|nr:hypothetical protein GCM10010964_31490 [Caldovatus sediminis]